jgi:hypothetical protein
MKNDVNIERISIMVLWVIFLLQVIPVPVVQYITVLAGSYGNTVLEYTTTVCMHCTHAVHYYTDFGTTVPMHGSCNLLCYVYGTVYFCLCATIQYQYNTRTVHCFCVCA